MKNNKAAKKGTRIKESMGSRVFNVVNVLILAFLALICF